MTRVDIRDLPLLTALETYKADRKWIEDLCHAYVVSKSGMTSEEFVEAFNTRWPRKIVDAHITLVHFGWGRSIYAVDVLFHDALEFTRASGDYIRDE